MTKKSRNSSLLSLALVASLLAACGAEQKPSAPPVADTAFGDMAGAVDQARAVEGTVQDQKEAVDRALEQNDKPAAE